PWSSGCAAAACECGVTADGPGDGLQREPAGNTWRPRCVVPSTGYLGVTGGSRAGAHRADGLPCLAPRSLACDAGHSCAACLGAALWTHRLWCTALALPRHLLVPAE